MLNGEIAVIRYHFTYVTHKVLHWNYSCAKLHSEGKNCIPGTGQHLQNKKQRKATVTMGQITTPLTLLFFWLASIP